MCALKMQWILVLKKVKYIRILFLKINYILSFHLFLLTWCFHPLIYTRMITEFNLIWCKKIQNLNFFLCFIINQTKISICKRRWFKRHSFFFKSWAANSQTFIQTFGDEARFTYINCRSHSKSSPQMFSENTKCLI